MLPRVKEVVPLADHRLRLQFTDNDTRIFECAHYLDKGLFRKLQNLSYFNQVRTQGGTVCWPDGQDFCPDMLYLESRPLTPSQLAPSP